ncbi:MAG: mechanosensitive ion channel [Campylobacterota bacterium]|nr:mechanosensitive ion channel [Campylobacterota bacterium]
MKLLLSLLLFSSILLANDLNLTQEQIELEHQRVELLRLQAIKEKEKSERIAKINAVKLNLDIVRQELSKKSRWMRGYSSYLSYKEIKTELSQLDLKIKKLSDSGSTMSDKDDLDKLQAKSKLLNDQIELIKGHGKTPFTILLEPSDLGDSPEISNPIDIFAGFSYIKSIGAKYQDYISKKEELGQLLIVLRKEINLYEKIINIDKNSSESSQLHAAQQRLNKFEAAFESVSTTSKIYKKRVDQLEIRVNDAIQEQLLKLANSAIVITVLFIIFFLIKQIIKKYITDNERFYMANKILTFSNVTLVVIILLFTYIENVSYLVTVLGFASAGIAIAMKDWFMSMLGWLVLVIGGSVHVGDRIKVVKDGIEYVGDVLDISLLRITILEDVTLTSYMLNRRAGRIIFIPNNYVFTNMIANYSHNSLKTVWDGIDITITFDSNRSKAAHLVKEITRKYSKGYTDITRKQLNKLRNRYNLKNTNVEPRVYTFIESNGIRVSTWYLTNAYATLTLRSTISSDIVDAFNAADDIQIAYPTQNINLKSEKQLSQAPMDLTDETKNLL